jgi:hypothetical protein
MHLNWVKIGKRGNKDQKSGEFKVYYMHVWEHQNGQTSSYNFIY